MTGEEAGLADLWSRPVAVIKMAADGTVIEFSPEAEAMFGYTRDQAIGATMSELIIPERLRAAHETGLAQYLRTGVGRVLEQVFELPALRSDGTEFLVELVVTVAGDTGEETFTGTLQEVAPRRAVPGELALSQVFYRTLIDRSPVAISVVEADGSWRWSSDAGVRLHGPLKDGASPLDRVAPEDQQRLVDCIAAAAAGEHQDGIDLRVRDAEDSWHALTVAAENLLHEPAVHGIGLYATDMTRLVRAEEAVRLESARLNTLIGSLSVGILMLDNDHHVVLVNTAFTELFGVVAAPHALIGMPATALSARNPFAEQEASDARGYELLRGGVPVAGDEYALIDGRIVERDYVPVRLDGEILGHLWVFRDVTEQALIRRGLEERNQALADLASLKTEFIATASHELRTPLTSILTFAHLIQEPGAGPAEHSKAIGAITRNADRMLQLVDDLILLASLEAGTAPLRLLPVDLNELVRSAMETWRPVALKTAVTLEEALEDGPRIQADSRHLHQLIDTLLGNAVATTPRSGRVVVRTAFTEPCWTIRLECSSGGGDHKYTRPGRHDDPAAAHSNALALLLSRAIVARHGGKLSSPGEENGTTYIVRLPLTPPPEPTE